MQRSRHYATIFTSSPTFGSVGGSLITFRWGGIYLPPGSLAVSDSSRNCFKLCHAAVSID